MLAPMRRLATRTRDAVVLLLGVGVGLTSPAYADSYDDEEPVEPEPEQNEPTSPDGESDNLSAGGLEVPDGFKEEDDTGDTVGRELEEGDRRDSGRGLEFAWLVGDIGLGAIDVAGLGRGDFLAAADASSGVGLAYGGGLGVRILYFTLGARLTGAQVGTFQTLGFGGELGMKLPIGNLEPFALFDMGYVGVTGLALDQTETGLTGVGGLGMNLGAGADYYLSDYFSVGA